MNWYLPVVTVDLYTSLYTSWFKAKFRENQQEILCTTRENISLEGLLLHCLLLLILSSGDRTFLQIEENVKWN